MNSNSLPNDNEPISAPDPVTRGQKTADTPERKLGCVVSVDYFSVTFHPPESLLPYEVNQFMDSVIEEVSVTLHGDYEDWIPLEYGYQGYRKSILGPAGARLHFDPPNAAHFNLSLPGQACQLAGSDYLKRFFGYCIQNCGKARRIDLALDDFDKLITPQDVEAEFHSSNAVTHLRTIMGIQESKRGFPERAGATRYLGAASSDRRLRVYDKNVESGGKVDAIRWELQARRKAAEKCLHDLGNGAWGEVIRRYLVGLIDFRVHDSAVEVEDRTRWAPYEQLMQGASKAAAYFPVKPKTIEEFEEYWRVHQGPSIAIILEHHGGDLGAIIEIAKDGKRRWRSKHKALLGRSKRG